MSLVSQAHKLNLEVMITLLTSLWLAHCGIGNQASLPLQLRKKKLKTGRDEQKVENKSYFSEDEHYMVNTDKELVSHLFTKSNCVHVLCQNTH